MKLTILIMTLFLLQVSAASRAQISITAKQQSLRKVLKSISQQSGYDFVYSDQTIGKTLPVTLRLDNVSIETALEKAFSGQPLIYELSDRTVMIRAKEDKGVFERIMDRLNAFEASGKVVDADGRPLPGATIRVKSGKGSTVTDANGRFTLGKVEEGTVLVISYTGYVSKEVVASVNMGNIVLEVSLSKLDEVQVIAYGTTTQRLSTGNVTTIKADVIEKQPVSNPLLALQGRVPGLFIEQATGFAGTGVKVRIQGQNSIANGNDPFYVIDGIPFVSQSLPGGNIILGNSGLGDGKTFGNPLNFINPSDIESIDVLKDADATAIYGSRAANGAILITTKKGKSGNIKANANLQNGWGKISNHLDLMNAKQYLTMRKEALKNDGIISPNSAPTGDNDLNGNWDNNRETDWQKELIGGAAQYTDLQGTISGGNNVTTFIAGAGYHKEGNVFAGNFKDIKNSLHFTLNSGSTDGKFKIQFGASYLDDSSDLPKMDLTGYAMTLSPVAPNAINANGSLNWQPVGATNSTTFFQQPMTYLYSKFNTKTNNLLGSSILSYMVFKGLEIKSVLGYNKLDASSISYSTLESLRPEYLPFAGNFPTTFTTSSLSSWSIEPQVKYNRPIGEGQLEILIGSTLQKQSTDVSSLNATGFATDQVREDIKSATSLTPNYTDNSVYRYNALFGRLNYNFDNRYIINLTARRDGSSRFGSENQFHNFGSIGTAWIFTNERILKGNFDFLSFGKLRASYGSTGSDQINNYSFLSLYSVIPGFTMPYQGVNGYRPNNLSNPYLQWEETKKLQIGLDLGFLRDRILINTNYSRNRSSNQLLQLGLPYITGFNLIAANLPATVQNTGWEFSLSTINLNKSEIKWNTSINLTIPKNKLLDVENFDQSVLKGTYVIGESINLKRLYHFLGVDPSLGIFQFQDRFGNPTISPGPSYGNVIGDDNVIISTDPKYYGGFQNSFEYNGFQLDFLFQFTKQIAQNYLFSDNPAGTANAGNFSNVPEWQVERWQSAGDIKPMQKYTTGFGTYSSMNNAKNSDAAWTDASYIRLKNVSFSWRFHDKLKQKLHLDNCKLYIQAQNLFTITSYRGLDPESKSSLSLPPLRTITLGVQVGI